MRRSKKGFSLIELLGVVVILGILLIIAVPQVYKYIKKGKENYYVSMEREASIAAANYVEEYRALLPRQIGHVNEIGLNELVESRFIDELKDENGDSCTGKVIVEKTKKDSYEYYACLECGENGRYYKSANTNCGKSITDNKYADSEQYDLVPVQLDYSVAQFENFTSDIPQVKVYKNNNGVREDVLGEGNYLEGNPKQVDTTTLGVKPIVYYYHGRTITVNVHVYDDTPPSAPSVAMVKAIDNKIYDGSWYSGDIIASFKSTDYSAKGVKGVGIDYYEVSATGEEGTYTRLDNNTETLTGEGEYTRYVRAVDKDGHVGPATSYVLRIDKTPPTCSWTGESTDWQPNLNLPEEQRVYSRTIVATCSDAVSDCMTISKIQQKTYEDSIETEHLSYAMFDLAGNFTDCNKDVAVYIDKTPPVITAKANPLSRNNTKTYQFINNTTPSDGHSGIANETLSCNPAVELGSGKYNVTCEVYDNVGLKSTVTFQARHSYPGTPYSCQCNCHSVCEWISHCNDDEYYDFYDCYYVDGLFEHCHDECSTCTCYRCPQGGSPSGSTCYY